jgi:succinate dehydrogenase / fumarate reductase, cytochrome b subunit
MVKLPQYLTYRGKGGHWSWILHRLTGLGVLVFLLIHILDISLIGWGPRVFDRLLFIYRGRVFRVMEVLLAGAVIYHALNGIRIVIIDFWPAATTVHRKLIWAVAVIFVVVFVPTAILMLNALVK